MTRILVTGATGYVGSKLLPKLKLAGHEVIGIDTMWFGNHLKQASDFEIIKSDFRDILEKLQGVDVVIHLANVANDPAVELDPALSWEINVLGSRLLADAMVKFGVPHLVYASSGSVYGIQTADRVTEDLPLEPISVYNKTKMCAEAIFMAYSDKMAVHIVRPATVCGLSPRMRLDVAVNMLTFQAIQNGIITVLGGSQTRPNIHIDDMVAVYEFFLKNKEVPSGPYNAGFENITIKELANEIASVTGADIVIKTSNDPRSYRQDSSKLIALGFSPSKNVRSAISEILDAHACGELEDRPEWHTVRTMKGLLANA